MVNSCCSGNAWELFASFQGQHQCVWGHTCLENVTAQSRLDWIKLGKRYPTFEQQSKTLYMKSLFFTRWNIMKRVTPTLKHWLTACICAWYVWIFCIRAYITSIFVEQNSVKSTVDWFGYTASQCRITFVRLFWYDKKTNKKEFPIAATSS